MVGAADRIVADLVILAIDTLQVAVAEKNIADPISPADGRLLASVDAHGGYVEGSAGPAETRFTGKSAGMTIPWAEAAIFQLFQGTGKCI